MCFPLCCLRNICGSLDGVINSCLAQLLYCCQSRACLPKKGVGPISSRINNSQQTQKRGEHTPSRGGTTPLFGGKWEGYLLPPPRGIFLKGGLYGPNGNSRKRQDLNCGERYMRVYLNWPNRDWKF